MNNKIRIILSIFLLFFLNLLISQSTNLIPWDDWSLGPINNGQEFVYFGTQQDNSGENEIIKATDPFGNEEKIMWKASSDEAGDYTGMITRYDKLNLNPSKTYRFSVWVKSVNTVGGRFMSLARGVDPNSSYRYGGNVYQFESPNGSLNRDVYFRSVISLQDEQWILMVGFIKGVNSNEAIEEGGLFTLQNIRIGSDVGFAGVKFNASGSPIFEYTNAFHNPGEAGGSMYFYDPRVVEVNGQEPSILQLINPSLITSGGFWTANDSDIHFTNGNVGIGVTNPDAPLTVKGQIHTNEVLVDVLAPIVPDYVFYDDYQLKSLEEVELFINENGHLPDIKSADEFSIEGMELKQMNLKLLEKIEELTLYIIEQNKSQKRLEKRIQVLEAQK